MGLLGEVGRLVAPVISSAQAAYAQVSQSANEIDDIDREIRLLESGNTRHGHDDDDDDNHDVDAAAANGLRDSGYLVGMDEKGLPSIPATTTYKREAWVLIGYMTPLFMYSIVSRYCTVMGAYRTRLAS